MQLFIFGAQAIALETAAALRTLDSSVPLLGFLVTSLEGNPVQLCGLPVLDIERFRREYGAQLDDILVLIATPENVQARIEEMLENVGIRHHQQLTSRRWAELMELYHARLGQFQLLRALPVGVRMPFVRAFCMRSEHDTPLQHSCDLPEWIIPIQVGAAGSSLRVSALRDDTGENISQKNGNYCELTGLYWVWRNRLMEVAEPETERQQYYGLFQYRRMLALTDEDLLRMVDGNIDVILPWPMLYEPDVSVHHKRYIKPVDWQALERALSELAADYVDDLAKVMRQQFFYNYNILLARRSVLRDYCSWLFPLLERIEELSRPKGGERHDRYIGYMAESLETLYFMANKAKLKIVHVGCRFLV